MSTAQRSMSVYEAIAKEYFMSMAELLAVAVVMVETSLIANYSVVQLASTSSFAE